MKKIFSSLVVASLVAGSLYAANGMGPGQGKGMNNQGMPCVNNSGMMNQGMYPCMNNSGMMPGMGRGMMGYGCNFGRGGGYGMMGFLYQLNLTQEQQDKVQQIMLDNRKNQKLPLDAFSEKGFDKEQFIKNASDRRDDMIKARAEVIEKIYNILDAKQKEQLKVLIDLRKDRMNQMFQ